MSVACSDYQVTPADPIRPQAPTLKLTDTGFDAYRYPPAPKGSPLTETPPCIKPRRGEPLPVTIVNAPAYGEASEQVKPDLTAARIATKLGSERKEPPEWMKPRLPS
jgi:hypothetical protein